LSWQFTLYGIFLLLTAGGVFSLAFLLRYRRNTPGVGALAVMTLAAGLWALGAGLELIAADETYKLFWGKFQYLGIVWLPVGWFAFALSYTGRGGWLSRRNILLLSVIPAITLLLVFTNNIHGLIWSGTEIVRSGGILNLRLEHGPAFWVDWVYAYVLLLVGTIMLLLTLLHSPRAYQMQGSVLLFAVAAPWIGNALYILDLGPLGGKDPTPFAFAVCVAAMFYGISNLRLLDLAPLARHAILDYIKDGVLVLDLHGRVVDANNVARSISELPRKNEVVGDESPGLPPELGRILSGASTSGEMLLGGRSDPRCYEVESYEMRDGKDQPRGRMVLLRDVTERHTAQERLRQSEERYRAVMEQAAEGIFLCDTRTRCILETNAAFQRLLGYSATELTSMSLYDLIEDEPESVNQNIWLVEAQGSVDLGERRYRRKDGRLVDIGVSSSLVHYGEREVLCTVVRDLTSQKELERRLEYRAFHDPLTELPNRELFTRYLQSALSGESRVALLFVDLDDFKRINDNLGHDCGDELLIGVANRLTHCLRPEDFASRLGGDEFTVIIGGAYDEEEVGVVARRVEERLRAPFGVGGRTVSIGASIGLAFSEPGDILAEKMLRKADGAMYGAKRAGKSQLKVFDSDEMKPFVEPPDYNPYSPWHYSSSETTNPE
jgi:diguanylate cyclase (GGDEF)-like protein/PAS domain S-box-containing protein